MNISPSPQLPTSETVELSSNFNIPIVLVVSGSVLFFIQGIVATVMVLFGIFLLVQTILIKLKFTTDSLEVYRGKKMIRSFPYKDWENWQIYWQPIPILFYFKEVHSIHFLPIIFDAKILHFCLNKYVPKSNNNP